MIPVLLIGLCLVLGLWGPAAGLAVARSRRRRLREHLLREATAHLTAEERAAGAVPEQQSTFPWIAAVLARRGRRERLEQHLRAIGVRMAPAEYFACLVTLWLAVPTVAWGLGQHPAVVGGALAIAVAAPFAVASVRQGSRKRQFTQQLPDAMEMIASSLRVGHGLQRALLLVATEAEEPLGEEFRRVMDEVAIGAQVDAALRRAAERTQNRELELLATVVGIQMQVGGNMAECFDRISLTLREREELANELKSLTAEGKLTAYVCTGMPPAMGLMVAYLNPDYMAPLIKTPTGHAMLGVTVVMQLIGVFVMKRMMKLEA